MDKPILIDTSVYIKLLRQNRDPASVFFEHYDTNQLVTCGFVRLEVLRGVRDARVRERLGRFLDTMQYVSTDAALWDEAALLAWQIDRAGYFIPNTDAFIAACAFRRGAAVLTHDLDFRRIPGLTVFTPPETLA
jgi:predicted nucleic acid-binding protein